VPDKCGRCSGKNGQVYTLIEGSSEIQDGLKEVGHRIREIKQEIQNIPVAKFKSTKDFKKLQRSVQQLEKMTEELSFEMK